MKRLCAWAAELVRTMGWARLFVTRELAPGMVKLVTGEEDAVLLTIKPGTYAWAKVDMTRGYLLLMGR